MLFKFQTYRMKKLLFSLIILASCQKTEIITAQSTSKSSSKSSDQLTAKLPSQPTSQSAVSTSSFDIQGHRGCRGLMPENTIPGFIKGLDVGASTLEMDIAISKDNKVIVSHSPFFNHVITTKPNGTPVLQSEEQGLILYKMYYTDIKKYDVGSRGNPSFPQIQKMNVSIPLLSRVFDSTEAHARNTQRDLPYYNIEIKSYAPWDNYYYPPVNTYSDLLMAVILQKNISNRIIIQSFDVRALKYMHLKYPSIKLALNIDNLGNKTLSDTLTSLGFTPYMLSINYANVNGALVLECKTKGIQIIAYTVDDLGEMKRLKLLGLNGIITDYPNVAKDNL